MHSWKYKLLTAIFALFLSTELKILTPMSLPSLTNTPVVTAGDYVLYYKNPSHDSYDYALQMFSSEEECIKAQSSVAYRRMASSMFDDPLPTLQCRFRPEELEETVDQ